MSIDVLQEKIRKLKNPSMVDLALAAGDLPGMLVEQERNEAKAYGRFCLEMLENLKALVPAVRVGFTAFALMGVPGLCGFVSKWNLASAAFASGNPMAIAGTLAIMTGGDREIYEKVRPILECMGKPVYTGGIASGSVTKLVNNMIGGAMLVAIAEGYAFAAKAGIDLQTTFEATRSGFIGGPLYENKVPKLIGRDFEPGARVAVHRKDILNAKHYAHKMGLDTPMTDVVLQVMDWMRDNGHIDEDQIAMVKYYEDKMNIHVGERTGI